VLEWHVMSLDATYLGFVLLVAPWTKGGDHSQEFCSMCPVGESDSFRAELRAMPEDLHTRPNATPKRPAFTRCHLGIAA